MTYRACVADIAVALGAAALSRLTVCAGPGAAQCSHASCRRRRGHLLEPCTAPPRRPAAARLQGEVAVIDGGVQSAESSGAQVETGTGAASAAMSCLEDSREPEQARCRAGIFPRRDGGVLFAVPPLRSDHRARCSRRVGVLVHCTVRGVAGLLPNRCTACPTRVQASFTQSWLPFLLRNHSSARLSGLLVTRRSPASPSMSPTGLLA